MVERTSLKRPGGERLMRPGEVSAVFGVTPAALRRVRKLTVRRTPGGHRRYLPSEVYALAAALTVKAEPASPPVAPVLADAAVAS